MPEVKLDQQQARRRFLQVGLASSAFGLLNRLKTAIPAQASAQINLNPDTALTQLMDGNKRFVSGRITIHEQNVAALRRSVVDKQEPFAAVLSCADSRVPVELVFDQSIGRIFVTRLAGNVVTPEIIGSLEYGVAVLGAKVVLVLGHSGCGAVKATIQGEEVPGQISALFPHIQPAVLQAGSDLAAATKANARIQATLLRGASTVVSRLAKENKIKVVAGYYELSTGAVELLP
jgi:carbonic anhydrase